jgi:hypothetical protein
MSHIVAARFERAIDVNAAVEDLKREGFAGTEIESFYVAPPGQHALLETGGDVHSDAGARFAGFGAIVGAVGGAALGFILGSVVTMDFTAPATLLCAGIGAYVGAFAGALGRLRGGRRAEATREHPVEPPAGSMLAVNVDRPATLDRAVAVLRSHGAREIGRAEGDWRDGSWRDFDPRSPLGAV